jgi:hypothetical protein
MWHLREKRGEAARVSRAARRTLFGFLARACQPQRAQPPSDLTCNATAVQWWSRPLRSDGFTSAQFARRSRDRSALCLSQEDVDGSVGSMRAAFSQRQWPGGEW